MKLLIIGDSVALPRKGVEQYETYGAILQNYLMDEFKSKIDVEILAYPYKTIIDAQNDIDDILTYSPDYLIIHIGLNDCAPRLLSKNTRAFLDRRHRLVQFALRRILRIVRKPWICLTMGTKKYTIETDFESYLNTFIEAISSNTSAKIIVLTIPIADRETEYKTPHISYYVNRYNILIRNIVSQFNVYLCDAFLISQTFGECIYIDHSHFGVDGHKLIAKNLLEIIKDIEK